MQQYGTKNLGCDLHRIQTAFAMVDLSEILQSSAPMAAGQLLRDAQEELQKLIAEIQPSPSIGAGQLFRDTQEELYKMVAEISTGSNALRLAS